MGFFDIQIQKDITLTKEQQTQLKNNLLEKSKEAKEEKRSFECKAFKLSSASLRYNLSVVASKNSLTINGELQHVLLLTVLIVLAILFTYGFGVIVIVAYAFYQKRLATKYIEEVLKSIV